MQDVANAAGVGKATVSLALRDDPRLRPETRKRIQELAEKMGYRTNATVANLMAQLRASKTPKYQATLGFINASPYRDAFSGLPTFRDWITGCKRRAAQLGYGLDEFWLNEPGLTPARLTRILESRGIRGLVFCGILDHDAMPAEFAPLWTNCASVVVGIRTSTPPLHFVCNDQYTTAKSAVFELLKLGYQRPGLVMIPRVDEIVDCRFSAGFWAGQLEIPEAKRAPIAHLNESDQSGFRAWFTKHQPDVVVCIHTEVKRWLDNLGARVPEHVGLAHLDRTPDMTDWAGMQQNNDLVGAAAVDMLIGQLHRNESGLPKFTKSMFIQSTWITSGSVRPQTPTKKRKTATTARS